MARTFPKIAAAWLILISVLISLAGCAYEAPDKDISPEAEIPEEEPLLPPETAAAAETAGTLPDEPSADTELPAEPDPDPAPEAETDPPAETETDPPEEAETDPPAEVDTDAEPLPSDPDIVEPTPAEDAPEPEVPAETEPPAETNIAGVKMEEVLLLRKRDEEAAKKAEEERKKQEEEQKRLEEERKKLEALLAMGYVSYLDGLPCTPEEQQKRPVAIMLNNLRLQLPQYGLDYGQIFYECVTEGSITRLMMLTTKYENMGTVGSIRSSRDIFAETVPDYDAIYVHAGGSPGAYNVIANRGINNLDAANMYLPSTYFRDQWRLNNIGYEHSLMTNGAGIVSGIQFKGYRTELKSDYTPVFTFYKQEVNHMTGGTPAEHVRVYSTPIQTVDFVYSAYTGEYLRYQYNGIAHNDGTSGTQISVKNVILLFMDISVIPGDEASRVAVSNVGTGSGYYMTNGQAVSISWSRASSYDSLHYTYPNGDPLILNAGKPFICIVEKSAENSLSFNYKW